ncbi:Synaptotagmin-7, partial [Borealophlyctis nickersoniae]
MSRLEVTIVEARNLKDHDTVGEGDPYIELWIDEDYKQKTSTQKNNNNPVYNETFTFNLTSGKHVLHLKAIDKDVADKDKIGEGKLDFGAVVNGGTPID